MSKHKPTLIAKANGGNNRSFTLDALTEARLAYLVDFYREVIGVKTSGSGVVRRAVADLVVLADEMAHLARILPSSTELRAERARMAAAMQGDKAPWTGSTPELAGATPFPTFAELCEQHRDKRPPLERVLKSAGMATSKGAKGGREAEREGEGAESGEGMSSAAAA